jgi:DNA-binding GntR family transcriptional regulator
MAETLSMHPAERISLNRQSTAQQVASILSRMIFDGVLRAGEPLRESALATSIGVSRNTLREAVRILERGALVTYEVNRGSIVTQPKREAVAELYLARGVIETAAARRKPTSKDLERLAIAMGELRRAAEVRPTVDIDGLVVADLGFHKAIAAMLGSQRLSALHDELCTELRFYVLAMSVASREYEKPEQVVREHEEMFSAIAGDDRAKAEAVVADHLHVNSEIWLSLFPLEQFA